MDSQIFRKIRAITAVLGMLYSPGSNTVVDRGFEQFFDCF